MAKIETTLSAAIKAWPVKTYAEAVTLMREHLRTVNNGLISRPPEDPSEMIVLLRLTSVLLRHAPEGQRAFVTYCAGLTIAPGLGTYAISQPLITAWFGVLANSVGSLQSLDAECAGNGRNLMYEIVTFMEGLASEKVGGEVFILLTTNSDGFILPKGDIPDSD